MASSYRRWDGIMYQTLGGMSGLSLDELLGMGEESAMDAHDTCQSFARQGLDRLLRVCWRLQKQRRGVQRASSFMTASPPRGSSRLRAPTNPSSFRMPGPLIGSERCIRMVRLERVEEVVTAR